MFLLYNILIAMANAALNVIALFSPKIKKFVKGRKDVFGALSGKIQPHDKTIWFHAASLGEYEQGLPVIQEVKKQFPEHKIILTFFSPSGYEVRKNTPFADAVVYLPMDIHSNARNFIQLVRPEMTFFIKYEFWPNYLRELKKRNIPTYLISGIFRENQVFFKWYGGFYRQALKAFSYFFVQNESSKVLIQKLGYYNVSISGDTRFDRVSRSLIQDNDLPFIERFKDNKPVLVAGSTWPKDEEMLLDFINDSKSIKFIIAPHNINTPQIENFVKSIRKKVVLFSGMEGKNLSDYDVFIVDTIGILTKIYSYADVAYVGGAFGTSGLHNILEPAAFGVPVVIGPNHQKFPEAAALINMGGCISVKDKKEMNDILIQLFYNNDVREEMGHVAATFIHMNRGAVTKITDYIKENHDSL